MDEHMQGEGSATSGMTEAEAKAVEQAIDDAMRQGAIAAQKIAGKGKGNNRLEKSLNKRDTNWKQHLREFFEQIIQGDEYSRFCPPNKRMLASGFVMPSHFDLATGEIIVACDTSGSMYHILPVVFGEIGLSGEVRAVSQRDLRLKEAAKLGFGSAIAPSRRSGGRADRKTDAGGIALREIAQHHRARLARQHVEQAEADLDRLDAGANLLAAFAVLAGAGVVGVGIGEIVVGKFRRAVSLDRKHEFICTQDHWTLHGRPVVRDAARRPSFTREVRVSPGLMAFTRMPSVPRSAAR